LLDLKGSAIRQRYPLDQIAAAPQPFQKTDAFPCVGAPPPLVGLHIVQFLKTDDGQVLGLSFKPDTDDLREAPSLDNVALLFEMGANIYAYDPAAEENFKKSFPYNITYTQTPEEALKDADVCFIFTEWHNIREIPVQKYKELMRNPLVYDGRNIYKPKEMKAAGVEYYSIGRPR
jgi:UDP-N-acetyl-D-mannosaminuronate dehydrogenase